MWRADLPSMTVASRGLVALDVTVTGAAKDLHSGRHGGSAPNPVRALTAMLATLHDADGRIAVPGFHDGAFRPIRRSSRRSTLPPSTRRLFQRDRRAGARADAERQRASGAPVAEPTLEFNGIFGGYSGPGTKTVIPSSAGAKITCRLVAGQDPARSPRRSGGIFERSCRPAIRWPSSATARARRPFRSIRICRRWPSPKSCSARCWARRRCGSPWARRSRSARSSRSISAPALIFFSFSTSDEDYHAPNEFFRLENFRIGQIAWARLFERLGTSMRGNSRTRDPPHTPLVWQSVDDGWPPQRYADEIGQSRAGGPIRHYFA